MAPGSSAPLKVHWYVSGGVPDAVTVKVAAPPSVAAWLAGCVVMRGAPAVDGSSTLARSAAAVSGGNSEKKVKPVSVCSRATEVRYCCHGLVRMPGMLGTLIAITRVVAVMRDNAEPGPGGTTTAIFQTWAGTAIPPGSRSAPKPAGPEMTRISLPSPASERQ